jgi:recombination protein RecA
VAISKSALDIIEKEIASLEKQYKEEGIVLRNTDTNSEAALARLKTTSTGSFSLDKALGVGGLPFGRTVEVFGEESSGKTTLCWNIIASAQKQGQIACMIDSENSADLDWAAKQGVNIEDLFISQPSYGEMAIDVAKKLIGTGQVGVVIFDSAAAMLPKIVYDSETNKRDYAQLARMLSQELPQLQSAAFKSNTLCLWTNQVRDNMDSGAWGYTNPFTTPGGHALKFYSSIRIQCTPSTKDGESGRWINAAVVKNKVAPPFRKARFYISYERGIDLAYELWDSAKNAKILVAGGAYWKFAPDPTRFPERVMGTEGVIARLRTDEVYRKAVMDALRSPVAPAPEVVNTRGQEFEEE